MSQYRRPPIVEAVIELLFSTPIDFALADKAAKKFVGLYPVDETDHELSAEVHGLTAEVRNARARPVARRLSSADRSEIFLIRKAGYLSTQLPPYPGWEAFFTRARRDYDRAEAVIGHRSMQRLGMRYINRIDVPYSVARDADFAKIVTLVPPNPPIGVGDVTGGIIQIDKDLGHEQCRIRIAAASVEPTVPETWALLLDIDIYRTIDLPLKNDDLFALIESLRPYKNKVFESLITPFARELFDR